MILQVTAGNFVGGKTFSGNNIVEGPMHETIGKPVGEDESHYTLEN